MQRLELIGIAALSLIVGGALGMKYGLDTGQEQAHAMEAVEMAHYAAFLKMQLAEGTEEARESALRGFLEMNEARRERRSPLYLQNVYAVDAGTAWVRLADLLERRGASAEAKDALHRAQSYCSLTGWKDCSVERFQIYARHYEGWGVFVETGLGR